MIVRLDCSEGHSRGARFEIREAPIGIGRSRDNQVRIAAEERAVSAHHCLIFRQEGQGFLIRDLGSTNGTLLNGFPIEDDRAVESGDVLKLGKNGPAFIVTIDEATSTMPLPIQPEVAVPAGGFSLRLGRLLTIVVAILLVAVAIRFGPRLLQDLRRSNDPVDQPRELDVEFPRASPRIEGDLEDPPEQPLEELPPLEDWILGRWTLARVDGAVVVGPAGGNERLVIQVTRDPEDADLYVAVALEIGSDHRSSGRLVDRLDRSILRFKYLRASSERGGTAYFRVSSFDARRLAAGGDGWLSRNDRAYVDLRRGQLLGNAGVWLQEERR